MTLDPLRSQIRAILLSDWDPHNAAPVESAHATYDAYIDPLLDLLKSGANEQAVMDWLHQREQETMCFPSMGRERLRWTARKLIRITSPQTAP